MQENRNLTAYRQQLYDRILDTAMSAFTKKGIKAVKMDDIAQQLVISKRTLYEIFENKEVLLYEGVRKSKRQRNELLKQMVSECSNVMDLILLFYHKKVEEFKLVNPQFYEDLVRYPRVLDFLEEEKDANLQQFIAFLKRGVSEGYFRSDIDYEVVTWSFSIMSQNIMSSQLYNKYSMEYIMYNLIFVSLRGFCTQKGIEVLDGFMKTLEISNINKINMDLKTV